MAQQDIDNLIEQMMGDLLKSSTPGKLTTNAAKANTARSINTVRNHISHTSDTNELAQALLKLQAHEIASIFDRVHGDIAAFQNEVKEVAKSRPFCREPVDLSMTRKTSANCVHYVEDNAVFVKIRNNPSRQDALITEVVNNQIIDHEAAVVTAYPPIFVKYLDHCVAQDSQALSTHYETMRTVYLGNTATSLCSYIRSNYTDTGKMTALRVGIEMLLITYKTACARFYMSHNDIHLNNLMVVPHNDGSQTINVYMIDYGRCWIHDTFIKKHTKIIDKSVIKYHQTREYFLNERKDTGLTQFQIQHPHGYLCDAASIAYNFMFYGNMQDWPIWFNKSSYMSYHGFWVGTREEVLAYLNLPAQNRTGIFDALAWLALYVMAFNVLLPSFSLLPSDDIDNVSLFVTRQQLEQSVLMRNGCFDPRYFPLVMQVMNGGSHGSRQGGGDYPGVLLKSDTPDSFPMYQKHLSRNSANNKNGAKIMSIPAITNIAHLDEDIGKIHSHMDEIHQDMSKLPPVLTEMKSLLKTSIFAPEPEQYTDSFKNIIEKLTISIDNTETLQLGGQKKSPRTYQTRVDKAGRMFIRRRGSKWYLDEHRGQYRYSSPQKTQVVLAATVM